MSLSAGAQDLDLLNEDTGFALTTPEGAGAMRDHLGRLLYYTRLKAIQWINPNRPLYVLTQSSCTARLGRRQA
jgi:hypothetical protein